jgi:hypothetical protein
LTSVQSPQHYSHDRTTYKFNPATTQTRRRHQRENRRAPGSTHHAPWVAHSRRRRSGTSSAKAKNERGRPGRHLRCGQDPLGGSSRDNSQKDHEPRRACSDCCLATCTVGADQSGSAITGGSETQAEAVHGRAGRPFSRRKNPLANISRQGQVDPVARPFKRRSSRRRGRRSGHHGANGGILKFLP